MSKKIYIEVDVSSECIYAGSNDWRIADCITAEGNNLQELLETATIHWNDESESYDEWCHKYIIEDYRKYYLKDLLILIFGS